MKMFHVHCFILDKYIHDVMTMLEKYKARSLEIKTVFIPGKTARDIIVGGEDHKKKPAKKGNVIGILKEHFDDNTNVTKKELLDTGIKGRHMGVLIRYGYITKLKTGDYVVKHLEESNS